jgi:hypothetical protein
MNLNRLAGGIAALALLATPAIASAHGTSSKGHHRHHARHQAKKAQTREVTGPATATVTSFTGGELTITLANGKSYSGLVTDKTNLKCNTAAPQSTTARAARNGSDNSVDDNGDNSGRGQDQSDDDAQEHNSQGSSSQVDNTPGANNRGDDDQDDDNGQGDDNGNGACDISALVAGTKVSDAKLSLKGTDATWKTVELVK